MVEINYVEIDEIPGFGPEFLFEWYSDIVSRETISLGDVNVILCSDEYLLEMNREHLDHDYYTDIITFDYSDESEVSGDLFVSLDRVRENALSFECSFEQELLRVCGHGVLHLCGYKDKSDDDEKVMRMKEEEALALVKFHVKHLKGWSWTH